MITGGGFSLLSEAVALRKPVLSLPLHGQFEQTMNARYLERDGFGRCAEASTATCCAASSASWRCSSRARVAPRPDNAAALRTIEEVVTAAAADSRARAAGAAPDGAEDGRMRPFALAAWAPPPRRAPASPSTARRSRPPSSTAPCSAGSPARTAGSRSPTTTGRIRRYTPALLDLLDRFDAKATFFLIGRWAEREPGLVRELADRGHAIGNHTYDHPTMPLHRDDTIREELRRCRGAIEAAGVELSTDRRRARSCARRTAAGGRARCACSARRATSPSRGRSPATTGARGRPRERIGRRAVRATGGDIILLHDGNNHDPAADRSRSLEATRIALEHHTPRGMRFVTVPELAAA